MKECAVKFVLHTRMDSYECILDMTTSDVTDNMECKEECKRRMNGLLRFCLQIYRYHLFCTRANAGCSSALCRNTPLRLGQKSGSRKMLARGLRVVGCAARWRSCLTVEWLSWLHDKFTEHSHNVLFNAGWEQLFSRKLLWEHPFPFHCRKIDWSLWDSSPQPVQVLCLNPK